MKFVHGLTDVQHYMHASFRVSAGLTICMHAKKFKCSSYKQVVCLDIDIVEYESRKLYSVFTECKYLANTIHMYKWCLGSSQVFIVSVCPFAPTANMMSGVGSGSGLQVIDSPLLTQQIEAQRLCIKHLKNDNNRLKVLIISPLSQHLTPHTDFWSDFGHFSLFHDDPAKTIHTYTN